MDFTFPELAAYSDVALAGALAGLLLGGLSKGLLGIGLPLIAVPLLATVLPTADALAIMWAPMVATNFWQAFQGGQAGTVLRRFWPLLLVMLGAAFAGTALLVTLDSRTLLGVVGAIVVTFAVVNLTHPRLALPAGAERPVGLLVGAGAGLLLGVALHMGPLLVLYFVALKLPKETFIRAIGLTFFAGCIAIGPIQMAFGVFEWRHVPLTLAATVPVLLGTWAGQKLRTRIDEDRFRKGLFVMLILIGLNLIRKGVL